MSSLRKLKFLLQLILVTSGCSRASMRDNVVSVVKGRLHVISSTHVIQNRLFRRDLESIDHRRPKHIRLSMDDKSPPLDMEVTQGSVWGFDSEVIIVQAGRSISISNDVDPGCYLHGKVTSGEGFVNINRCDRMTGVIDLPDMMYTFEEIMPDDTNNITMSSTDNSTSNTNTSRSSVGSKTITPSNETHIELIISKKRQEVIEMVDDLQEAARLLAAAAEDDDHRLSNVDHSESVENNRNNTDGSMEPDARRTVRQAQRLKPTVEVAVYAEETYMTYLTSIGITTKDKILDWFITKWNTIQEVYNDVDKVGFKATFQLKRVVLWRENPEGFVNYDKTALPLLYWFCRNTPHDADHKVLYTIHPVNKYQGWAIFGRTCQRHANCYLVKPRTRNVFIELHEMGHSLSLEHDDATNACKNEKQNGFMGRRSTYRFLKCYKRALRQKIRDFECLYRQDVVNEIRGNLTFIDTNP